MSRVTYLLLFFMVSILNTYGQNDGQATLKIVGGETVQEGEYPWMVSLVTDNGMQGCGASLIAPQWVLTAGHCSIDFPGAPQNIQVLIHALVTDTSNPEPFSEIIDIEEIFVHDDYDLFGGGPDIALIRLSEPAITTPVELAEYADSILYSHGMPGKVLGWGKTEAGGNNSDSLLLGNTNFIGNDECGSAYSSSQFGNPFIQNPDGLICAGYLPGGSQVVGAAQGDSGGPLFFEDDDGQYKQVGVVSFGNSDVTTEDFPGVFTLVPQYRDWIDDIMSQFDDPTSVSNINVEQLTIKYFANDRVNISNLNGNDDYSVEVFDISGTLKRTLSFVGKDNINLSITDFHPGLYILTIVNYSKKLLTNKKLFVK